MTTYVAFLRGINVGGHKKVQMRALQQLFVGLGYDNVSTYLQTGNVIFTSAAVPPSLAEIEARIAQDLGVAINVVLRTSEDLAGVIAHSPFAGWDADPVTLHVTFLATVPEPDRVARLEVPAHESVRFWSRGREVYLHCPDGYGRTKLNNSYIEKRLGVVATTRNWRVINHLCTLVGA